MAQIKVERVHLSLDKVERKKIAELKELHPLWGDLEPSQLAHIALKDYLFKEVHKLKKDKRTIPLDNAGVVKRSPLDSIFLKFLLIHYRFLNKLKSFAW